MAARGWGKEAEFIPQSHTFFLTYTPVVRWQAPSLSNATRRKGLKGKTRWRILCGEAILEENRSFFFISQIWFQLLVTMVTRIHVVDTLEQTQSPRPPVAATPLSLSLRPPCVPGRVTVQSATTKEAARHCYRKRRHGEAALPTPAAPVPPLL